MSTDAVTVVAAIIGVVAMILEHLRHRRLDGETVGSVASMVTTVAVLSEKVEALRDRVSSLEASAKEGSRE
jgi:membrane protein required for beta-lactamase induction